jgi:hypothetical protein
VSDEEQIENSNEQPEEEESSPTSRFPEMDELQSEIDRRIRDNQKFLDHFLDKDYIEEDDDEDDDDGDEFEEL